MNLISNPDTAEKLAFVGEANRLEVAGDRPQRDPEQRAVEHARGLLPCITELSTPTGAMPVLKTMVTTACEKNCYYCPFRAGRSRTARVSFKPDELAAAFDKIQRVGLVRGLFLSSGIIRGGVTTQDKILDTVEIVRRKYEYRGYIHLKIMPGAEYDQVARAMQLADRVSINLEGPTQARLDALAPKKDFSGDLLERLRWTQLIRARAPGRVASTSTQFVVGAVGDTDLELMSLSAQLYGQLGLKRAYYSSFSPVEDTPLENVSPTAAIRELRLYQAGFLLRDYQWDVEDLPFMGDGNLRLDVDPKRAWAEQHLRQAPLEIMRASRDELLRVPGIGPGGADAILQARRSDRLKDLSQLRAIGIRAPERTAPYILLDGRSTPHQLPLFSLDQ